MYAGKGEAWVITFTTQLRNQLGAGYILTHARTSNLPLVAVDPDRPFLQLWRLGKLPLLPAGKFMYHNRS
jgi:hypothetical protein